MNDNNNCISYESHFFEFFLPSPIIFSKLCISYDKTELFIISLTRIFIYIIIYYLLDESISLDNYRIIKYILLVIIFANIIYIGAVISKKTVFNIGSDQSITGYENIVN